MTFTEWKHDDLADDLADSLATRRRMVWCDMQLGPAHSIRPDVWTMEMSFVNPLPTAYEIKISRGDLLRDLKSGKCLGYFAAADQVFVCFPQGMATPDEISAEIGIMVRCANAWRTIRRAPKDRTPIADHVYIKLLIDGVRRERIAACDRRVNVLAELDAERLKLSADYRSWCDDVQSREYRIGRLASREGDLQQRLDDTTNAIDTLLTEAAELLGVSRLTGFDIHNRRAALLLEILPANLADELSQTLTAATNSIAEVLTNIEKAAP